MFQVQVNNNISGYQTNQITGVSARFQNATFIPVKSFTANGHPTYNSQPVYFGFGSGQLPFEINSGQRVFFENPDKGRSDLQTMYYRANSGDGLFVICNN